MHRRYIALLARYPNDQASGVAIHLSQYTSSCGPQPEAFVRFQPA
jgi:hypothetical protein